MHKHKSKSKSHRWGAWSEWTWDSSQQANVRVRQDSQGHLEYEWDQQDLNQPGHARTPREAAVEDITDRLNCLSTTTNEAHYTDANLKRKVELADEYAYAGEAPEQAKAKKTKSKNKDKEKSHRRHASSDGKSSAASQDGAAHPQSPGLQFAESAYGDEYQQQDPTANVSYSQYGSGQVAYSSVWSRTRRYGAFAEGSEAASSSQTTEASSATQQYAGEELDGASSRYGEVQSGSEAGSPTLQQPETAAAADGDYMPELAENGETELDPRYQIEHSARFQPGEIFKVHWSEPQGSMSEKPKASSSSPSSKKQDLENKFGTKFFVGFRRFIVVANDQGHCTCVPILTYGGKGCKKHGVKPEKHGIVCERGQKPKRLDGEPSLGFAPVRVEMTEEGERLARESRVNYSKLVTVEHNVKVFFIGHVYPGDWQIVGDAVNYCWNKKIHQKQRHK